MNLLNQRLDKQIVNDDRFLYIKLISSSTHQTIYQHLALCPFYVNIFPMEKKMWVIILINVLPQLGSVLYTQKFKIIHNAKT